MEWAAGAGAGARASYIDCSCDGGVGRDVAGAGIGIGTAGIVCTERGRGVGVLWEVCGAGAAGACGLIRGHRFKD